MPQQLSPEVVGRSPYNGPTMAAPSALFAAQPTPRPIASLAACPCIASPSTSLMGWAYTIDTVWGFVPGAVPTKANAALACILAGMSGSPVTECGERTFRSEVNPASEERTGGVERCWQRRPYWPSLRPPWFSVAWRAAPIICGTDLHVMVPPILQRSPESWSRPRDSPGRARYLVASAVPTAPGTR